MFTCSFCHDFPITGYCAICGRDVRKSPLYLACVAAEKADRAFEAAVKAAGYKSRWDVPALVKRNDTALAEAYNRKVLADSAMSVAFQQSRQS